MKAITAEMADHAVYITCPEEQDTPDEPWIGSSDVYDWYAAAAALTLNQIGSGPGKCLVIGSPIFEAMMLQDAGWDVTYLDVREAPPVIEKRVRGDATDLPFPDSHFDAVSCTCVLCHVGLGRYGDPAMPDGDRKALGEIARVMRPWAKASIMFGPSMPSLARTVVLGRIHRIYQPTNALLMLKECGLKAIWSGLWFKDHWLNQDEVHGMIVDHKDHLLAGKKELIDYCYLSMLLEK